MSFLSCEIVSILGEKYKDYRKALGLSQRDIHLKTGIAISTISLFENGKGQGMSLENLVSLLKAVELEDGLTEIIPVVPSADLEKEWNKRNRRSR